MQNVTLAIDEQILAEGREYARQRKTSLNHLVRSLLEQTVKSTNRQWWQETIALMNKSTGSSNGQKWTREELHRA